MSIWVLLLVGLNIGLVAGLVGLWIKINKPQRDDPRLSKGLQLLQAKIAVLEDVSERSETQVNQLIRLLDKKIKEVQTTVQRTDDQLAAIDRSMKKSLEVAEIFEDKIPHEEIIERQNSKKYVRAAQMAYQGYSIEDISQEVSLSRAEVEFIVKLNKDKMLVDEDEIPDWARVPSSQGDLVFENIPSTSEDADRLKDEFQKACRDFEDEEKSREGVKLPKFEAKQVKQHIQSFVDGVLKPMQSDIDFTSQAESEAENILLSSQENSEDAIVPKIAENSVPATETSRSLNDATLAEFSKQRPESTGEKTEASVAPAFQEAPETSASPRTAQQAVSSTELKKQPSESRFSFDIEALKKAAAKSSEEQPSRAVISGGDTQQVRKVQFPKIDIDSNLS